GGGGARGERWVPGGMRGEGGGDPVEAGVAGAGPGRGGGTRRVVAVIEDITAEHEATATLRESATLMRLAGRLAKVGGSIVYPDGRVYWSDEIAEMLEYPPGTQFSLEEALALYPDAWRPVI